MSGVLATTQMLGVWAFKAGSLGVAGAMGQAFIDCMDDELEALGDVKIEVGSVDGRIEYTAEVHVVRRSWLEECDCGGDHEED